MRLVFITFYFICEKLATLADTLVSKFYYWMKFMLVGLTWVLFNNKWCAEKSGKQCFAGILLFYLLGYYWYQSC